MHVVLEDEDDSVAVGGLVVASEGSAGPVSGHGRLAVKSISPVSVCEVGSGVKRTNMFVWMADPRLTQFKAGGRTETSEVQVQCCSCRHTHSTPTVNAGPAHQASSCIRRYDWILRLCGCQIANSCQTLALRKQAREKANAVKRSCLDEEDYENDEDYESVSIEQVREHEDSRVHNYSISRCAYVCMCV